MPDPLVLNTSLMRQEFTSPQNTWNARAPLNLSLSFIILIRGSLHRQSHNFSLSINCEHCKFGRTRLSNKILIVFPNFVMYQYQDENSLWSCGYSHNMGPIFRYLFLCRMSRTLFSGIKGQNKNDDYDSFILADTRLCIASEYASNHWGRNMQWNCGTPKVWLKRSTLVRG